MCPAPLPSQKNITQNSTKQIAIPPIKFFSLTTIRDLSKICNIRICAKFHKNPTSSQEIEKNTRRQTKKYPKMASRKGGLALKNFFSAVSILE